MALHDEPTTTDELFRIVMIDIQRKVEMQIKLRDEDGDEVPVRETIQKLTEWVSDKMKDEESNVTKQQVVPLMAQAVVGGLIKLLGDGGTSLMLSNETTRWSLIHMMTVGFYLLKWIQKKKVDIYTTEHALTDEDIAMYNRCSRASDACTQFAAMGGDPKELLKEYISEGQLTREDLVRMGVADILNQEEDDGSDNKAN